MTPRILHNCAFTLPYKQKTLSDSKRMDASDRLAARRVEMLLAEKQALKANPPGPKGPAPRHRPRMLAGMTKASRMSSSRTADIEKVAINCGPVVETATLCCALPTPSPNTDVPSSNQYMHREMRREDDCERIYREQMARHCHKGDGGLFVTRTDVRDSNNPRSHNAGVHTVAIREIIEEQRPSYADALLPIVPQTPVPCPPSLTDGYYEPSLQSGRIGPCAPFRPSLN